jgi:uncharacterized integral membrane protein
MSGVYGRHRSLTSGVGEGPAFVVAGEPATRRFDQRRAEPGRPCRRHEPGAVTLESDVTWPNRRMPVPHRAARLTPEAAGIQELLKKSAHYWHMSDLREFPAPHERRVGGVPVRPKTVAMAVILILAIWFIAINRSSVKIHLYFSTVMAPLWIVLAATTIGGMLIGWFGSRRAAKKRQRRAEPSRRRR